MCVAFGWFISKKKKKGKLFCLSGKKRSIYARFIVCLEDFTFDFIFTFNFLPNTYTDQLGKHFQQEKICLCINMLIHMKID